MSAAASGPTAAAPAVATPDRALRVAGWIAIAAPLLALAVKLPSFGWLMVGAIWMSPLLLGGYALLVLAAARGMLRRGATLRAPRWARIRAIAWAWLTSGGVVLVGLAIVDGGDTMASVQSTLTILLGSSGGDSPLHDASMVLALVGAIAWGVGWLGLIAEWLSSIAGRRWEAAQVAPPVLPPAP
ncbi:hypothetical protein [Agrococcus terreus]|uniref:Uncharacterized protein n=1 Tax=Agrococcus terreus TaxID=574649 RepID=A0ABQ2KDC7_9MICO|nr:hypothetical protein [Agrococcus terreus]GGN77928.1 hypothetical protein GCM10010968_03100 [Agrococcus terreus]